MPVMSHAVASTCSIGRRRAVERVDREVRPAVVELLRSGADRVERRLVRLVGGDLREEQAVAAADDGRSFRLSARSRDAGRRCSGRAADCRQPRQQRRPSPNARRAARRSERPGSASGVDVTFQSSCSQAATGPAAPRSGSLVFDTASRTRTVIERERGADSRWTRRSRPGRADSMLAGIGAVGLDAPVHWRTSQDDRVGCLMYSPPILTS